jgi:AcrR family transcriptional regulator
VNPVPVPPEAPAVTGPRGSRRRGGTLLDAIFAATLAQLRTVGYAKLTVEGVAAAAQTGKAALYRRWSGKEELVTAALRSVLPDPTTVPLTDDPRTDILVLLGYLRDTMDLTQDAAFQIAKKEAELESGLAAMVQGRVMDPVREMTMEVLRRAEAAGQTRPGVATHQIADVGPAMLIHHALTVKPDVSDEYLASIVDDVILPLIRP